MKKMFKRASALLLSTLMMVSLISVNAFADESSNGEWEYFISNETKKEIWLTGYNGSDDTLVVPHKIDGYSVVVIYECSFANSKSLKNVVIPDSMTGISYGAFANCTI